MKSKAVIVFLVLTLSLSVGVAFYVDSEPETLTIKSEDGGVPVGYYTTKSVLDSIDVFLNKRGGYMSNDMAPPFVFMDNMPSWEQGALKQIRDISLAYRNHISRSQSQSAEDKNLVEFQTLLNNDSEKWILPSAEGKYKDAYKMLNIYYQGLSDSDPSTSLFYARADNLVAILEMMNTRLGSLSQRLSASVGGFRKNTDLAGDPVAKSAKDAGAFVKVKTPWIEIDNVFYETRGSAWALINFLKAIRLDFDEVLKKKNATRSLDQIIRELESTQSNISSPMILNGGEFGLVPNYSLAMSSYVTRANAGILDLINLLKNG